jgi:hypothetical protein
MRCKLCNVEVIYDPGKLTFHFLRKHGIKPEAYFDNAVAARMKKDNNNDGDSGMGSSKENNDDDEEEGSIRISNVVSMSSNDRPIGSEKDIAAAKQKQNQFAQVLKKIKTEPEDIEDPAADNKRKAAAMIIKPERENKLTEIFKESAASKPATLDPIVHPVKTSNKKTAPKRPMISLCSFKASGKTWVKATLDSTQEENSPPKRQKVVSISLRAGVKQEAIATPAKDKKMWWDGCQYRCFKCSEMFTEMRLLRSHAVKKHKLAATWETVEQSPWKCKVCNLVYMKDKGAIEEHLWNCHEMDIKEYSRKKMGVIVDDSKDSPKDSVQGAKVPEKSIIPSNQGKKSQASLSGAKTPSKSPVPEKIVQGTPSNSLSRISKEAAALKIKVTALISTEVANDDERWDGCKYRCPRCHLVRSNLAEMYVHSWSDHKCKFVLDDSSILERRLWNCGECGKIVMHDKAAIFAHLNNHDLSFEDYDTKHPVRQGESVYLANEDEEAGSTKVKVAENKLVSSYFIEGQGGKKWYDGCSFQCDLCPKVCSHRKDMSTHVKTKHGRKGTYKLLERSVWKCTECQCEMNKEYTSIANHLAQKHKITILQYEKKMKLNTAGEEDPEDVDDPEDATKEPKKELPSGTEMQTEKKWYDGCLFQCDHCPNVYSYRKDISKHVRDKRQRKGAYRMLERSVWKCTECKSDVEREYDSILEHLVRKHKILSLLQYEKMMKLRTEAAILAPEDATEEHSKEKETNAEPKGAILKGCLYRCRVCSPDVDFHDRDSIHKHVEKKHNENEKQWKHFYTVVKVLSWKCTQCDKEVINQDKNAHLKRCQGKTMQECLEKQKQKQKTVELPSAQTKEKRAEVKIATNADNAAESITKDCSEENTVPADDFCRGCLYRCKVCPDKEYHSSNSMHRHIKEHHCKNAKKQKNYFTVVKMSYWKCTECSTDVVNEIESVQTHMRVAHEITVKEYLQNKQKADESAKTPKRQKKKENYLHSKIAKASVLRKAEEGDQYRCLFCKGKYLNLDDMQNHVNRDHESKRDLWPLCYIIISKRKDVKPKESKPDHGPSATKATEPLVSQPTARKATEPLVVSQTTALKKPEHQKSNPTALKVTKPQDSQPGKEPDKDSDTGAFGEGCRYKCGFCLKEFNDSQVVRGHISRRHKDKYNAKWREHCEVLKQSNWTCLKCDTATVLAERSKIRAHLSSHNISIAQYLVLLQKRKRKKSVGDNSVNEKAKLMKHFFEDAESEAEDEFVQDKKTSLVKRVRKKEAKKINDIKTAQGLGVSGQTSKRLLADSDSVSEPPAKKPVGADKDKKDVTKAVKRPIQRNIISDQSDSDSVDQEDTPAKTSGPEVTKINEVRELSRKVERFLDDSDSVDEFIQVNPLAEGSGQDENMINEIPNSSLNELPLSESKWWDGCKYECSHCSAVFSDTVEVEWHMEDYHADESDPEEARVLVRSDWKCELCQEEVVRQKSDVSAHLKKKHDLRIDEFDKLLKLVRRKTI